MQIRTIPEDGMPDGKQPGDEQAVLGYTDNEEGVSPTDDDDAWWLPDEEDMTGPNGTWRNCAGQWSPPEAH